MSESSSSRVKVAVVRGENRRDAVARALALVADDVRACVTPHVLVKPNLVSHKVQLPSTHADTFAAALDALFSAGARCVTAAEGATDAPAGFERFGLRREAAGLPVAFFDVNRDETEWVPLTLTGVDGRTRTARVSRTVAESGCRVSLALAKTHVTAGLTLGLKNMLSSLHPSDRVMMHGHEPGGNGYKGWKRLVVEFLKGDSLAVRALTRGMGRVRNVQHALRARSLARRGLDPFETLTPAERAYVRSVAAMHRNLAALATLTKPHVSVVDGFLAMHREGPRHGTPLPLRTVVAGTDAVAVDAVAAALMGFDPRGVGFLVHAEAAGLGVADLDRIEIVGDPIASVRRRAVPHSNHPLQRLWNRVEFPQPSIYRGPHFGRARSGTRNPEADHP